MFADLPAGIPYPESRQGKHDQRQANQAAVDQFKGLPPGAQMLIQDGSVVEIFNEIRPTAPGLQQFSGHTIQLQIILLLLENELRDSVFFPDVYAVEFCGQVRRNRFVKILFSSLFVRARQQFTRGFGAGS